MIKTHIHVAVDIPTADPTSKLLIEPGTNGFIVLSSGTFKVGVNAKELIEAIYELDFMKIRHSLPKEEVKVEPAMGEILEGDEETAIGLNNVNYDDIPF